MASTTYDLKLNISANNQASWELDKVSKQTENLQKQSIKLSESTKKTLKWIWVTATAVTASMVALWKSFIDASIENEPLQRSFERLSKSAWIASDEMLKAMKKASRWTVSNTKLMASANKAYSLWVVSNVEDMSTIMEIARVKGQAMWRTMEEALDDIVTWLWRWSVQILDNLWIVIKQTEAQELYAQQLWKTVDQLTEAEKKQALVNAVVAQWKEELAQAGEVQETMQEKIARVNATWENMQNTIGDALIPVVDRLLQAITPIIDKVVARVEANPELTATIFEVVTAVAWLTAVFSWLALALPAITTALWFLTWPIWMIVVAVGALATAWVTDWGWIRETTYKAVDDIKNTFQPFADWLSEEAEETSWEIKKTNVSTRDYIKIGRDTTMDFLSTMLLWFVDTLKVILHTILWIVSWDWSALKRTWELAQIEINESLTALFGEWFNQMMQKVEDFITNIIVARDNFKQACSNAINGVKSTITEVWTWMFDGLKDVARKALDRVSNKVESVWNSIKDAKNAVAWFFGFGGDEDNARANGWPVTAWSPYIVWERWPELFVPSSNWNIVPNEEISNNNNVTINMSGITIREDADITRLADEIVRLTKLEKNYWII